MNNRLKKNIIYNGLYQVFILLIPMITLPYVTRIFNPELLGINSYTLSIVQIFVTISFFGINNYGGREIAFKKDVLERNQTFWSIWLIQIVASIISFLTFYIFIFIIKPENLSYFIIQSFLIILTGLEISWFFVGIEEMQKVVIRNTTIKIVTTASIFVFVKNISDLDIYMWINILGILLGNLSLLYSVKKYVLKPKIDFLELCEHAKKTVLFLVPQFSILLYSTVDRIILGQVTDMFQVGLYDQSQKIIRIVIMFLTSITVSLMPRLSSLSKENNDKEFEDLFKISFEIIIIISVLIVVTLIVVAEPLVITLFGLDYIGVVPLMKIVSIIGIFIPLSTLLWNGILLPKNNDKIIVKSTIIAAVISVSLNMLLSVKIGAYGAVISLCIVEIFLYFYRLKYAKDHFNFNLFNKTILQIVIAAVITIIIGTIVKNNIFYNSNNIIQIVILAILCLLFFAMLLFVQKNETIYFLYKKIMEKKKEGV